MGDPFLAALLMPCMTLGEPLEIRASASNRLLHHTRRLMEIYHAWWPDLQVIPVKVQAARRPRWLPWRREAACYFSLEVDSYYTLFKNRDGRAPMACLLFVVGFDIRLDNLPLLRQVTVNLEQAAQSTGAGLLVVSTNVRELTVEEIDRIAHIPIVRATLRSCWQNRDSQYNCGTCEKCLRTMAGLDAVNALAAVATFPDNISFEALAAIHWADATVQRRFREVLEALPKSDLHARLRQAIAGHLARFEGHERAPDRY